MNKFKVKQQMNKLKNDYKYYSFRAKEVAKQIFVPLAIFQLVRTLIFPSPLDVFLVLVIFAIVAGLLIEWI